VPSLESRETSTDVSRTTRGMKRKLEAISNAETEHADDTFDGADEGADAHMCSKEYDVEKIISTRYNHVCAFLSLLSTSTNR
jgi:hypothetical protein